MPTFSKAYKEEEVDIHFTLLKISGQNCCYLDHIYRKFSVYCKAVIRLREVSVKLNKFWFNRMKFVTNVARVLSNSIGPSRTFSENVKKRILCSLQWMELVC